MSFNILPGVTTKTADSIIGSSGVKQRVYSISILSGGTAGVVNLRNGTTVSSTIIATITGTANESKIINWAGGLLFTAGLYYDQDANVTSSTITHSSEL